MSLTLAPDEMAWFYNLLPDVKSSGYVVTNELFTERIIAK
jgi:hypothetical protein